MQVIILVETPHIPSKSEIIQCIEQGKYKVYKLINSPQHSIICYEDSLQSKILSEYELGKSVSCLETLSLALKARSGKEPKKYNSQKNKMFNKILSKELEIEVTKKDDVIRYALRLNRMIVSGELARNIFRKLQYLRRPIGERDIQEAISATMEEMKRGF